MAKSNMDLRHSLSHSFVQLLFLLALFCVPCLSLPASISRFELPGNNVTCVNIYFDPNDYSVKPAKIPQAPICEAHSIGTGDLIFGRQVTQLDDYTCSEDRPCRNGACCPKATGFCNYGAAYCGTNNQSPNELCWSNCDAKAECGRNSFPVGKECPLHVCCGPWGYCGMTEGFCTISSDETKGCQSNCAQPGSGKSGGDVQKRVIGYYEMWVHERACNGMSIQQIPVGALTHLMFSFGYVSPGDFNIVPMDDLPESLFRDFSALKKKNSALKIMVALGGWTFNDPGPTQTVFHDVCSTSANRAKFIANLFSFFRQFGFDGVDFDWEYPGADDRGGAPEDGINFTLLLQDLKAAIKKQPIPYVVSFTTPTSFWYLRHFDLKASTANVDFVNIMSYDLHGVWDAWNPIGSNVLGHSNLTEIKLALDLYWRNGIPPEKLNLGIGFYGRSFQLSDPSCSTPGCPFLGGAAPGPCTKNSGTLAYREIVDIIKEKKLKPYYVKEDEIKYIVWNQDQWISYDDKETIQAKIAWANSQGLGGLLIWSIDQDTDDLQALTAVVGADVIALSMSNRGNDAAYWRDIGSQACYTTACGGSCDAGFIKIITQPCGGAKIITRHSTEADSTLCCPLTSAPDPKNCQWRGNDPLCNGRCHDGEVAMQLNKWGDGWYCEDGNKAYCCAVPQGRNNKCYWAGMGKACRSGDQPLTFAGTFLSDIADFAQFFGIVGLALADMLDDLDMELEELYCCPPADIARWGNCQWYGQPGSCFDNHCALNTQVQMTTNRYGLGQSCSPRLERARVFCCDPPDGEPLFPPVPLNVLFPNPPTGDNVDTKFELKIDNTWGDGIADTATDDDPDEAAVSFYIMVAPDEVQTSLNKRDGSHWDVYNCKNENEEEQTVQMVCTDMSNESNCDHISRGDGVPGTIISMPKGCGPGKYAVAVSMKPAGNQTLPHHLYKRLDYVPVVYDLTFDYRFDRVPRQFGETQLRVDYSNQLGYWDEVVSKAAKMKKKRSLEDMGGNHKRWLENEFRDDMHFGGLSKKDLHERWFGEDIVSWLRGLLSAGITPEFRHDYSDQVTAIILQEDWECPISSTIKLSANIDAVASADIQISTSFGFTLVATLAHPIDFSNSFLHFNNKGAISAIFTVDAVAKAEFDSGLIHLAPNIPLPGAAFRIPGVMTVGPQFNLDARLKAAVSLSGRMEAKVEIASWEIRQTMPSQTSEFAPQVKDEPSRNMDVSGLKQPEFDASVEAFGFIEAHILPTLSFGIKVDDFWNVGSCSVDLVADGWVRVRAKSDLVGGDCSFGYAVDAGAGLFAKATVPNAFKTWAPAELSIAAIERTLIPSNGNEWKCLTSSASVVRRGSNDSLTDRSSSSIMLHKRASTYGPVFRLPRSDAGCPITEDSGPSPPCTEIEPLEDEGNSETELRKREAFEDDLDINADSGTGEALHSLERRAGSKTPLQVCKQRGQVTPGLQTINFPNYPSGNDLYDNDDWNNCNNYGFGLRFFEQAILKVPPPVRAGASTTIIYIDEHVLEAQLLQLFINKNYEAGGGNAACVTMAQEGWKNGNILINGVLTTPWRFVATAYPSTTSNALEMVRMWEPINIIKENAFKKHTFGGETKFTAALASERTVGRVILSIKRVLMTYNYMAEPAIRTIYLDQVRRVQANFATAEAALLVHNPAYTFQNLANTWDVWTRSWTLQVIALFNAWFNRWVPLVEAAIAAPDPNTPDDADRAELRTKITLMRAAVDARLNVGNVWTSPL